MVDVDCELNLGAQCRKLGGVDRWLLRSNRDQANSHTSTLQSRKCLVVWSRERDGNHSPMPSPGAVHRLHQCPGIPNQGGDWVTIEVSN